MSKLSPQRSSNTSNRKNRRSHRGVGPNFHEVEVGMLTDEVHAHSPSEIQGVQLTVIDSRAENQCRTEPNWKKG